MKSRKLKTIDVEIAVAEYFNPRVNLIVPNISWGLVIHECDMLIVTKAGYAYEVEIKIFLSDLIKDLEKPHKHNSRKIKKLFFAIPEKREGWHTYIPEKAGILEIFNHPHWGFRCRKIREAKIAYEYKFSDEERYQVARLGAMRMWGLKEKIVKLQRKNANN